MQCCDIRPKISAWLDRELDAASAAAVEAHFGACPACAAYRDELCALPLDALAAPEPSAGFVARFERELMGARPRRSLIIYRAAAGALGLAATVAGFSIGLHLPSMEPSPVANTNTANTTASADSSETLVRDSIDPFGANTVEGVLLTVIDETGEG